jgi:hypothetical protein
MSCEWNSRLQELCTPPLKIRRRMLLDLLPRLPMSFPLARANKLSATNTGGHQLFIIGMRIRPTSFND